MKAVLKVPTWCADPKGPNGVVKVVLEVPTGCADPKGPNGVVKVVPEVPPQFSPWSQCSGDALTPNVPTQW